MVTTNMFGDILSDTAAMLTGSIGMLPSASLNEKGDVRAHPRLAPDIAGKGIAQSAGDHPSVAMMLRQPASTRPAWRPDRERRGGGARQGCGHPISCPEGMTEVNCVGMWATQLVAALYRPGRGPGLLRGMAPETRRVKQRRKKSVL